MILNTTNNTMIDIPSPLQEKTFDTKYGKVTVTNENFITKFVGENIIPFQIIGHWLDLNFITTKRIETIINKANGK